MSHYLHTDGRPPRSTQTSTEPRPKVSLAGIRQGAAGTATAMRRVFQLVWETSRGLTSGLGSVTLLQSVVPVAQVWLAGRLIDEVVKGIKNGNGGDHIRPVAILAILQLVLFLASSLLQTLANIFQQLLQEKLSIHVQKIIMEHANSLDLADFENATYYDQLQQAQNESTS